MSFNLSGSICLGIPGLFRGLTSTMAREMPGYFFFFGGYELTKSLLTTTEQKQEGENLGKTISFKDLFNM